MDKALCMFPLTVRLSRTICLYRQNNVRTVFTAIVCKFNAFCDVKYNTYCDVKILIH